MPGTVFDRYKALDAAFVDRAARGGKLYAHFAALASLSSTQDPVLQAERTIQLRDQLNEGLGMWASPTKSMRLVFAAALAASGRTSDHFFAARTALEDCRKARGGRRLTHNGACAALALVSSGGQGHQADSFYDILEAIAAPWWRRDAGREEVVAAIFAGLGETPEEALGHLNRARQDLRDAGIPKAAAEAAACEIAFQQYDARAIGPAWAALNAGLRRHGALRSGIGKTGMAVAAAHGRGKEIGTQLVQTYQAIKADKSLRVSSDVAAKLALRLTLAGQGDVQPIDAARDLAAILAAQAAMIVAATSASVAATTAATS
ncbi:hypothetical protein [Maricaulis parjimensis]|uniref:hypothetical protein n=1 Tax=Maricaulis parjimensis TaxID=144023 RepID=UPI00193A75AB|nr:hypothetical protein [Maricaulis parjimensis]